MEESEQSGAPTEPQVGQNPAAPTEQPTTPEEAQAASAPAPGDTPPNTSSAFPGVAEGDRESVENKAVENASDELPAADSEERNPAVDQAPAATEAQNAIIGDPGLRDEQEPQASVGSADIPHRTSAPPPAAQSGVPLPEDRAAGIQPGVKGPVVPVGEDAGAPLHDGSEGQSTTSPMGG
jgi:hypothetical protein